MQIACIINAHLGDQDGDAFHQRLFGQATPTKEFQFSM